MDEKIFYSYNTWKIGPFRLADGIIERDFTFDDLSLRNELLSASFRNFIPIVEKILGEEIKKKGSLIYIFIDEAQKVPGFIEYIKSLYDLKFPIKWILTGSSSLELRGQIKESLAGRVLNLTILPFSERETLKGYGYQAPDKNDLWDFIFKGAENNYCVFAAPHTK